MSVSLSVSLSLSRMTPAYRPDGGLCGREIRIDSRSDYLLVSASETHGDGHFSDAGRRQPPVLCCDDFRNDSFLLVSFSLIVTLLPRFTEFYLLDEGCFEFW